MKAKDTYRKRCQLNTSKMRKKRNKHWLGVTISLIGIFISFKLAKTLPLKIELDISGKFIEIT